MDKKIDPQRIGFSAMKRKKKKSKRQRIVREHEVIKESLSVGLTSKLEETSNETHREGCSRLREQHM